MYLAFEHRAYGEILKTKHRVQIYQMSLIAQLRMRKE